MVEQRVWWFVPYVLLWLGTGGVALSPILLGCSAMGGLIALFTVDQTVSVPEDATVRGRRWTRSVRLEQWARVTREARCDSLPEGAEIVDRRTPLSAEGRLHHHRSSRGSSSHPAPRCRYRIDDWTQVDPVVSTGGFDDPRSWPAAPSPRACPEPFQYGCVREAGRDEELILAVFPVDGAAPVRCVVAEATWDTMAPGRRVVLPRSAVFRRPLCDRLE